MLQAAPIEEGGGGGPYDNKREFVFWNPEMDIRASLRAPRLISRTLKLTTM
jgi:hypothetical protein